ncbi:class I SAM-dependent methyltransferase [Plantactinospora sp. GCM10030261]|uniref:class I SAM-dependent methyltransferase n=1 Tax=Plantactinospora sp. GCM10030261 TaxID=3273420 RepID=UPI003619B147
MDATTDRPATTSDAYERQVWNGRAAAYADSYAAVCAYAADELLDAVGVGAGRTVLDVGTGPGTVAARAVERGAVVGAVDAEPSMVELAARRLPTVDVRHAILPHLPYPDSSFDAVVANFVLNHVGRPRAAVAELGRVARPGGRIAVTVWPHPPSPMQRLWSEVLDAAGLTEPDDLLTVAADENFERTVAGFAGLLRDGGLTEVDCRVLDWEFRVDPARWWQGPVYGFGALGRTVSRLSPAEVAAVKVHYDRLVVDRLAPDGALVLPTSALLAVGRRAP